MLNNLQTLIFIYCSVLVINIVASLILYKIHRHSLFKILTTVWLFTFFNFFLQGTFLNQGPLMYLSFSSYLLVSISLYYFANSVIQNKLPEKIIEAKYLYTCLCLIGVGLTIDIMTSRYELASLFSAIAIAIPVVIAGKRLIESNMGFGHKTLGYLFFINALHFLDYPILRGQPLGAIIGFSIAIVILLGFSTLLPTFILLQISRDYATQLEQEVQKRTEQLEGALSQNKTLVNILCHDLSSPLTILSFCLDNIGESNDTATRTTNVTKAKHYLSNLFAIVSKVRDLQSISYGKKSINKTPVDLITLFNQLKTDFEKPLMDKNIRLVLVNHNQQAPVIYADADLLKNQVLANLISNSIKFSYPNSTISFVLSTNGKLIQISIEDKGVGIPPEIHPHLFKWGIKTNRKGTQGEPGTGFGLPLVKACTEILGGSITSESTYSDPPNEESGTKFIIQFERSA